MDQQECAKPNDEIFNAAVDIVQALPKDGEVSVSNHEKLVFYSLYKQATVGSCTAKRPRFWNLVERYKWEAWNSLGDMPQDDAKREYVRRLVAKIKAVLEKSNVAEMMGRSRWDELGQSLEPKFALINCPIHAQQRPPFAPTTEGPPSDDTFDTGSSRADQQYPSDDEFVDAPTEIKAGLPIPDATTTSDTASVSTNMVECASSTMVQRRTANRMTVTGGLVTLWRTFKAILQYLRLLVSKVKTERGAFILSNSALAFVVVWPLVVNLLFRYFGSHL